MSDDEIRPLPVDGPGAPPRKNGELVFAAPWEGRAFGIAMALCDRELFHWDEFRRALIAEIASWERAHPDGVGWSYYARWLAALEILLADKRIMAPVDLDLREQELAARPEGHDHRH